MYFYSYFLFITCFLSVILILYILNISLSLPIHNLKCGTLFAIKEKLYLHTILTLLTIQYLHYLQYNTYITYSTILTLLTIQYLHYLQYNTYITYNTILTLLTIQYLHYLQYNTYITYNTKFLTNNNTVHYLQYSIYYSSKITIQWLHYYYMIYYTT